MPGLSQRVAPTLALLSLVRFADCTNASLYSVSNFGLEQGDRDAFEGTVCAPIPEGPTFPVKVIFALEAGPEILPDEIFALKEGMKAAAGRSTTASIGFTLMPYHTFAALSGNFNGGAQGSVFLDGPTFSTAVDSYQAPGAGPISVRSPLDLANTIITNDAATTCIGTIQRTRYLIVLLMATADATCDNAAIFTNPNAMFLDPTCAFPNPQPTIQGCDQCVLRDAVAALKLLVPQLGVGAIDIQPIYFSETGGNTDPNLPGQLAAMEVATGVQAIQVAAADLSQTLSRLNYAPLQTPMVLKRLFAWNRNAIARAGQQYVDSDGDGLSDDDEINIYHTDPANADTDGDGLSDGVEVRAGLDPLTPNTLTGCDPTQDTDGDRLNDCEEQVLGTDACRSDTDGDALSDLVESHAGTDPLAPEGFKDGDGDGSPNATEVENHTDPLSSDNQYRRDRGYVATWTPTAPTEDGRACYAFRVGNISLVPTLKRPNPPFADIPAGTNDLYLYVQMGYQDQGPGEIVQLLVEQVLFTPPGTKSPPGAFEVQPGDPILGP